MVRLDAAVKLFPEKISLLNENVEVGAEMEVVTSVTDHLVGC